MLYSYNWLLDYLDEEQLDKYDWTAEKVGQRIMLTNWEYEGKEEIKFVWDKVVVGKVLSVEKHLNADKLQVALVDVGKNKLKIVCGANNLAKGMLVPVAMIGAKLGEMEIKEVELRGVKSQGMICSAQELGLEEKSSGILDLGSKLKIGAALSEAINFDDEMLNFKILPNRPDGLSMIGVAREVAVACEVKFFEPKFKVKENSKCKIEDMLEVNIKDSGGCNRYSARIIEKVKIKESPLWLKRRLITAGMRPINAVVDITNYVMLEYGQPMHAFDYDLIIGHKINVRKAKKGERILTLDGEKKVLGEDDLIIADEKRPLAVAGIIGGEESGVLNKTNTIVLESANFARNRINNSSRLLGITTESSLRFGKGLPMSWTIKALERATYLIQQICGGEVVSGVIDARSKRILKKTVSVDYEYLDNFLGIKVPKNEVKKILKYLDFEIEKNTDETLTVIVPEDRIDVECAEDLIEEVGRIYGFDKIPKMDLVMPVVLPKPEVYRRTRNDLIKYFFNEGLAEIYSYDFCSEEDLVKWGFEVKDAFELSYPMDQSIRYLRQSLIAGLAEKYKKWSKTNEVVKIFEWGKVFSKLADKREKAKIGFLITDKLSAKDLFLTAKGLAEGMLANIGIKMDDLRTRRVKETDEQINYLHPTNSLVLFDQKNRRLGGFGLIHPSSANNWKLPKNIVYGEFDLELLAENKKDIFDYVESSKFPVSKFDASFLVERKVMARELIDEAKLIGEDRLKKVEVFDEFEGEKLRITNYELRDGEKIKNLKSLGLRFCWQREDRTMDDKEVNELMEKIFEKLKEKFGAVLRDK